MQKKILSLIVFSLFLASARAEKTDIKVKDIDMSHEAALIIKRGDVKECLEFEIIEGHDEVFGMPEYQKDKGRENWQKACAQWKQSMLDLNKGNQIIALNCNIPSPVVEGEQTYYKSTGTYKIKVRVKEKK